MSIYVVIYFTRSFNLWNGLIIIDSQKKKTNTSAETMTTDTKQNEDEIEVEYVDSKSFEFLH